MNLLARKYLITVQAGFRIMVPDWSLSGLVSRIGHISVKVLQVKAPEYLNITSIVSPKTVVSLLDQPRFDELVPIAKMRLEKTPPPNYTFPCETGNKISGVVLIFVILLIKFCIISGILRFRNHTQILNKIKKVVLSVDVSKDKHEITE